MPHYINIPRHNTMRLEADLPAPTYQALADLAFRSGRTLDDLVLDASVLLLRFHGEGAGQPEPRQPMTKGSEIESAVQGAR